MSGAEDMAIIPSAENWTYQRVRLNAATTDGCSYLALLYRRLYVETRAQALKRQKIASVRKNPRRWSMGMGEFGCCEASQLRTDIGV